MQFWVFTYSYIANTFGGITFSWNYHNQIRVVPSGSNYNFVCSPFYDSNYPALQTTITGTLSYTANAWNFLSCAVDVVDGAFYLNTASSSTNTLTTQSPSPNLTTHTTSTLTISDNSTYGEWGVMFFRQIRLWMDCYTTAGFLSRVYNKFI
jgi:hypothetical protein